MSRRHSPLVRWPRDTLAPLVLLVALLVVAPLTGHGTPVDPSWLPGIYDAGDTDDAAALLTAEAGHGQAVWSELSPVDHPGEPVAQPVRDGGPSIGPAAFNIRAPPSS